MYYYRARYYNPDIGRFLTVDSILYSDNTNLYNYVINNPIKYVDPLGLASKAYNPNINWPNWMYDPDFNSYWPYTPPQYGYYELYPPRDFWGPLKNPKTWWNIISNLPKFPW